MLEHWLERWRQGRTGWHEATGNRGLRAHWRATGRRVLVPLCGKSPDLVWLADRGNEVFGVELSPLAVHSFFADQQLYYDQSIVDGPPHSVPSPELLSYWPELSPLESCDDLGNGPPKFREAGLDEMIETVWVSAGA